jgi:two-component system response regulator
MAPNTILLIEDTPGEIEPTRQAIQICQMDAELVVAHDGQEALDFLLGPGRHGVPDGSSLPRVTLLDLHLPKVCGLDVLRAIRADPRTSRLPVIVLTSSNSEKDIAACYDLGANSYIQKPGNFTRYVEIIRTVGAYWLHMNELPPTTSAELTRLPELS